MKLVELTNMCLIKRNDEFLFQRRKRTNFPGITFPGGHVEDNELVSDAIIREIIEETGLTIKNPKLINTLEWKNDDIRELALLYAADEFTGELKGSWEGDVFFARLEDIDPAEYSDGFIDVLQAYNLIKKW